MSGSVTKGLGVGAQAAGQEQWGTQGEPVGRCHPEALCSGSGTGLGRADCAWLAGLPFLNSDALWQQPRPLALGRCLRKHPLGVWGPRRYWWRRTPRRL